ncbi:MAG: restriction endonuclease subunit S [Paludibacteraceae bacterium]|nr:restriction endonuclease subunit S [Paludibacteraceae bacterium]
MNHSIMNLPQGYKQTELGIIPEDWEVKPFSQIFDMYPNNTYPRDCMNDSRGVVRNIHYGDVLIKYPTIVDAEKCVIPYLNEGVKIKLQKLVQSGDIIIADTAEDETVGKCVEIKNVGNNKIVAGLHTFFCRPTSLFAAGWLGYYINSTNYHNQLIPYITGIKVSSISRTAIQETKLLLPPIAEQRAIASALSDVDGLIAALDKKIAKKRLLKQGAMCKLLSLSGRGKKWFNIRLGNVVNIRKGSMLTSDRFVAGNIPVIAGGKIPAGYHNVANRPANTITISASGASAGYVALYNKPIFATDCSTIEPCSTYDIHYIYHLLKYYQSEIFAMQTGGAQPHVHPSDLNELQILYAKDIDEQQAIATILSDMDKEIAGLEAQRDKYRLLKSGMMQKLLTGQIRLKTK